MTSTFLVFTLLLLVLQTLCRARHTHTRITSAFVPVGGILKTLHHRHRDVDPHRHVVPLRAAKRDYMLLLRNRLVLTMKLDSDDQEKDSLAGSVFAGTGLPSRKGKGTKEKVIDRKLDEQLGEELLEAVKERDLPRIKTLVETGIDGQTADPDFANEFGFSCLHLAAKKGYLDVIELLVGLGADINLPGEGGTNPLHMAAQYGRLETVKGMVEMCADVDWQDNTGGTPLRLAEAFGQKEVAEFLRPLINTGSGQWKTAEEDGPGLGIPPWNEDDLPDDDWDPDEFGEESGWDEDMMFADAAESNGATKSKQPFEGFLSEIEDGDYAQDADAVESGSRGNQGEEKGGTSSAGLQISEDLQREIDAILGKTDD